MKERSRKCSGGGGLKVLPMKTTAGIPINMPFKERLFAASAVRASERSARVRERRKYVWICRNRDEKGLEGCSMKAVDDEKLKQAFVQMVNWQIKDTDKFISRLLGNIEKVFAEKANSVDVDAIDKRLDELREEIERLVKLYKGQS